LQVDLATAFIEFFEEPAICARHISVPPPDSLTAELAVACATEGSTGTSPRGLCGERYVKVLDRALLDAVEKVQRGIEELKRAQADRQQLELKFGDDFAEAKSSSGGGFPHVSALRPAGGKQSVLDRVVNC
jgi:hypothetical protein